MKKETYLRSELTREKKIYKRLSKIMEIVDVDTKTYERLYFLRHACANRIIALRRALIASTDFPETTGTSIVIFRVTNDGKIKEDIL